MISTNSKRARRWSSALGLSLFLLAFATPARADESVKSASSFMTTTVDDVLAILNDKSLAQPARLAKLETIALERFGTMSLAQVMAPARSTKARTRSCRCAPDAIPTSVSTAKLTSWSSLRSN